VMKSYQRLAVSYQLVKGLSGTTRILVDVCKLFTVNCQLYVERCPVDGNTHSGYRRMSVSCKLSTVNFLGTAKKNAKWIAAVYS
jgi:hypothetical protein